MITYSDRKKSPAVATINIGVLFLQKTFLLLTYQALVHGLWADLERKYIMNTNDCIYVANTHREDNRLNSDILFIRIPRKRI